MLSRLVVGRDHHRDAAGELLRMAGRAELLEREVLDQAGEVAPRPLRAAGEREGEQVEDADREHRGADDPVAAALAERQLVEDPLEDRRVGTEKISSGSDEHDQPQQQVAVSDLALAVGADRQRREHDRGDRPAVRSGVSSTEAYRAGWPTAARAATPWTARSRRRSRGRLYRSITTSVDSIRFSESSVGCEPERRQLRVHRVVVVLLRLEARVRARCPRARSSRGARPRAAPSRPGRRR